MSEVVGDNLLLVPSDVVVVDSALFDTSEVPCETSRRGRIEELRDCTSENKRRRKEGRTGDDKLSRTGDDALLLLSETSVEPSGRELNLSVHVADVFGLELQSSRNGLGLGRERAVEPELTLVSTLSNEGVNQEKVGLAGRDEPSTVGRNVDSEDGVTKSGKGSLQSAREQR